MLIFNHNFFVEIVNLFLLLLSKFFNHVLSGDEDCFEVVRVRECVANYFYFRFEVRLAVVCRHVLETFQLFFGFSSLLVVRNRQLMHGEIIWTLWMLVPILSLHDIVKTGLGLPTRLNVLLLF
jgi:hypothetical protein